MQRLYLIILFLPLLLFSQSNSSNGLEEVILNKRASQSFVFKRLYIFPTDVRKDKILGNILYEYTKERITEKKRFEMYDSKMLSSELIKKGLSHLDISEKETVVRIAETLKLDSFIQPIIRRDKARIDVSLQLLDQDGNIVLIEKLDDFSYKNNFQLKMAFFDLVDKLVEKIPYSGLITSIERGLYYLDVGEKDKFKQNDVLSVFEIKSVKRHPFTKQVVDFQKETVGRLILVEVKEGTSIAKLRSIKPGKEFLINMKVSKRKIPKDPFLFPEPVKTYKKKGISERFKSSLGEMEARFILATYKHIFNSDDADLNREVTALIYPEIQVLGDLWLTSKWIVAAEVMGGVVPIRTSTITPSSINAIVNRFSLHAKYRLIIGETLMDPQIIPMLGIYRYQFFPDNTDSAQLTKKIFYGPSAGAQFLIPLDMSMSIFAKMLVHPYSKLLESPQSSGDAKSNMGFHFDVGAMKKFKETVSFTGGIKADYYGSTLKAIGNNPNINGTTSITSFGVFVGAKLFF